MASFDTVDILIESLSKKINVNSLLGQLKTLSQNDFQHLLDTLSEAYHHSEPIISDTDYDLIESIFAIKYGKNIKVGAPPPVKPIKSKTKTVIDESDTINRPSGSKPQSVNLPIPMWGLDKLKDDHGLNLYKKRYKDCNSFVSTEKLDGNSVYLEYSSNKRTLCKRGDEKEGTDISYLLPYISIPDIKEDFAIRAELVMPLKTFANKYPNDSNTRNTVSGLTNSKTVSIDKIRDIDLVAYHIYSGSPLPQSQQLKILESKGFKIPLYTILTRDDLNAETLTAEVKLRKRKSVYDIDGICISADIPMELPRNKDPEHVIAFKILGETAVTTVKNLEWNVSKQGLYKPRVNFEPVHLDGAILEWATGNNARFVQEYGLGPGSKIVVTRSGGVISKILETLEKVEPQFPDKEYRWIENDKGERVDIALPEGAESMEQEIKKIVAFFKERGSEYLAKKTVEKLYEGGLSSLKDLFNATVEDIIQIDGFQQKGAERIVKNIEKAITNAPLHEIMAASSFFPSFGKKRLELITKEICELNRIVDPDELEDVKTQILSIKGFKKLAGIFIDNLIKFNEWLAAHHEISICSGDGDDNNDDDSNEDENDDEDNPCETKKDSLSGQTIVFTGVRADAPLERTITKKGGRITSAVSKQTTILVVKNMEGKETTKIKEARAKGVKVIGLSEFLETYGLNAST